MSTTNEIYDYVMNNPQDTNGSVLSSLLNALPTGGADLPEVTSDDNGAALIVDNGEWAKRSPIGVGYAAVAGSDSITILKSGAEVIKQPFFEGNGFLCLRQTYTEGTSAKFAYFYAPTDNAAPKILTFTVNATDAAMSTINCVVYESVKAIPATYQDKGKVYMLDGYGNLSLDYPNQYPYELTSSYSSSDEKIHFNTGDTQKMLYDNYKAGKNVVIKMSDGPTFQSNGQLVFNVTMDDSSTKKITFSSSFATETELYFYSFTIDGNSTDVLGMGVDMIKKTITFDT